MLESNRSGTDSKRTRYSMQMSRVIFTQVSFWTESRLYLELVDFLLHKAEEASGNSGFHKHLSLDAAPVVSLYLYVLFSSSELVQNLLSYAWDQMAIHPLLSDTYVSILVGGEMSHDKAIGNVYRRQQCGKHKEESSNF